MSEIESYDKEITEQLDGLKRSIDSLSVRDLSQRPALVSKCGLDLKKIDSWIETYQYEIGGLANRKQYQESINTIKKRFELLKAELDHKKKEGTMQAQLYSNRTEARNPVEMSSEFSQIDLLLKSG